MTEHKSLSAALAAAQADYPAIKKGSVNPHFKSSYADLADGMSPIRPILAKHGIAYTQTFGVTDGVLMLRTKLIFGAEFELSELPITQPQKPQDFISLTTYYRRVALFSICGITPEDEDDDGEAANKTTTTQSPPRRDQRPQLPPPARPVPRGTPQEETDAALKRQERDPLNIREAKLDERHLFQTLKRALADASALEADHLVLTYKDMIDTMPEAGRSVLQNIVVGKIEAAA